MMEQRSSLFFAVILLVFGTVIHSYSLDISAYSVPWPVSLLAIFHGTVLEPNLSNFLIAKVASFFLLWGFLKVFYRIGKPMAGFSGALLIAVYPPASLNAGYLAVIISVIALFWWCLVFTQGQHNFKKYLPAIISFSGAILLSPWMLMLSSIPGILYYEKRNNEHSARLAAVVISLLLCLSVLVILLAPFTQKFEEYVLLHDKLTWFRNLLTMGMTFNLIYSWGAAVLLCFGFFEGIRVYPRNTIYFIVCLFIVLLFSPLDLVGILIVWIIFSTWIALAFERIWVYLISHNKNWLANAALVFLVVCLFAIDQEGQLNKITQTKKIYKTSFNSKCGGRIAHPGTPATTQYISTPRVDSAEGCFLAWGNYHYNLPGHYRATFYICQMGAIGSFVDVSQGHGTKILAEKQISEIESINDCSGALTPLELEYTISTKIYSPVEHRVYYGNIGTLVFDRVEIEVLDHAL